MQITTISEIPTLVGQEFHGEPIIITEKMIVDFAVLTGDINQIHLDPTRAADSIFGGLIACGMLTTSLMAHESAGIWRVFQVEEHYELLANGFNHVQYLRPVHVESEIQYSFKLVSADQTTARGKNGIKVVWDITAKDLKTKKNLMTAQWVVSYISN